MNIYEAMPTQVYKDSNSGLDLPSWASASRPSDRAISGIDWHSTIAKHSDRCETAENCEPHSLCQHWNEFGGARELGGRWVKTSHRPSDLDFELVWARYDDQAFFPMLRWNWMLLVSFMSPNINKILLLARKIDKIAQTQNPFPSICRFQRWNLWEYFS